MWYTPVFTSQKAAMKKEYLSKSLEQTVEVAHKLAQKLHGGEVIALRGELGAGKTTFAQGLANSLGVTRRVNSPTFTIMRTYRIRNQESKIINLYHVDLYRIDSKMDLEGLGLEEILGRKDAVVVIEWPEKMYGLIPQNSIDIAFEYINDSTRKILISYD